MLHGVAIAAIALCCLGPIEGNLPGDPPAPHAQDPKTPAPELCPICHGSGRLDNSIENPKLAELESKVIYCSERIGKDPKGRGLPFVPCGAKCQAASKNKEAQAEFDKLAAAVDAWTASNAEITKTVQPRVPFVFIRTKHFDLIYGLPKVTLETREVFDIHGGAHLYASRLEADYQWFMDLLGMKDEEMRNLHHIAFLCDDLKSSIVAAPRYAQIATDRGGHKVGDPSVFVTWRDKAVFGKGDANFHKHVVHHITHMIQGVWYLKVWLAERAGWLDEGLAHVAEMRLFGAAGNTCNTETIEADYPDANWEPIVLRRVLANDTLSFASMMNKKSQELSQAEHQQAWSFVDFLLHREDATAVMQKLMRGVKDKKEMREVFRDATGYTTVNFDDAWATWVKENYKLKP